MDVHTRKLRYFVAVAEELNFTRAAARLYVAQQALSKQIRELEIALDVPLFVRTSRKVELTPAGQALLAHAHAVLATLDTGVQDARRAGGRHTATLRVGFGLGAALELTGPIVAEFQERRPDVQLELREYSFTDPSTGLADGSSDVALLRPPIGFADYDFDALFHEPMIALLSDRHPLASRTSVSVRELLDEPTAIGRSMDAVWQAYWLQNEHRDGRPPRSVIYTSTQTEELELVAAGLACSFSVAAAARYAAHPHVRCVPVSDLAPNAMGVAWRHDAREPAIKWFLEVAQNVRDREVHLVREIEHPAYVEAARG